MRKGWETEELQNITSIKGGYAFKSHLMTQIIGRYQVVKMSNLYGGVLNLSRNPSYLDNISDREAAYKLISDDIIVTLTGTVGKKDYGYSDIIKSHDNLLLNQRLAVLKANKLKADPDFLLYTIKSEKFLDSFFECSVGGTGNQANVSTEKLKEIAIDLPPLPEQRKIAAILRTWDEAIEKLEKLKQQRKKLFNQRRRQLTDITSGHGVKFRLLSEISKEINHRNDDYDAPVMMISSTQGFIRQDANYDREMAGESLKKYIYLKEGEFAYNKGNSKTYPYGCIFRLEVPDALIPFVYICFKLDDQLNAGYFRHYFEAGSINRQLVRLISSSVRGNGLLNIDADDFFSCRIPIPDRSYQDTCANFLDAATKELAVLDAEITFIKNQKRGLMQKLLTGAWRVEAEQEAPSINRKEKKHVG